MEHDFDTAVALESTPESTQIVRSHTAAMMAELVNVPVAIVRRWHQRGLLRECRRVRGLPYFEFGEVSIARHLADLLHAGCTQQNIYRKLSELSRLHPELLRPLADPRIVVVGQQLFLRRDEDLSEPGGQLVMDFASADDEGEVYSSTQAALSFSEHIGCLGQAAKSLENTAREASIGELWQQASDLEDQGALPRAAEVYRVILGIVGPSAQANFSLADVLYRLGDLTAARERLYVAVELDEQFIEARANLGCVLAETGELELAESTFLGALKLHADYADVHYHLAGVLERQGREGEARPHWERFLELAPESPWGKTARERLGG